MADDDHRGYGRATQSEVYRAGVSGTRPAVPVDVDALERAARKAVSSEAFAYLAGGAGTEATMAANRAAFDPLADLAARAARRLVARPLDRTARSASGHAVPALADRGRRDGARRCRRRGGPGCGGTRRAVRALQPGVPSDGGGGRGDGLAHSAGSSCTGAPSDDLNASFVRRAEASGCEAIVVTLDTHLLGWRTRDLDAAYLPFTRGQGIAQYTSDPVFAELVRERVARGGRRRPARLRKVTPTLLASAFAIARSGAHTRLVDGGVREALRSPLPRAAVETFLDVFSDPSLTWDSLAKLREWTSLPVLLKGIMHPDDAARALDHGVDGLVVSNHGGRQIDESVATLEALPDVVERVGGRVPVILDSGVRGGADAFIALALGATAVGIGRPYAYGLAVAGSDGVREVVRNHIAEFDLTMGLAGHRSVAEIGPDSLRAA